MPVLISLLLWLCATDVYSNESPLTWCGSFHGKLNDLKLQQPPRRVLLVPLLRKKPLSTENPRWPEQPARTLEAFYRNKFNAKVTQLRDVWNWTDYYQQIEQLVQRSFTFDRIIFISHGGYDGPILTDAVYWQNLQITGNKGKLLQFSDEQPGIKNVLSITYNTDKNQEFSDYMALRWPELVKMEASDIWHLLKGLEKQLQPLDNACYQHYCSPDKLSTSPAEQRDYRVNLCELICRESLFEQTNSAEISPERLLNFTTSLSSLATPDGLIFFGACNPGSKAPSIVMEKDKIEYLINSTLTGGPYKSYLHLVSSVTGHITAGPIGNSSAVDIVNRVIMFETGRPQHNLCIVDPATQ